MASIGAGVNLDASVPPLRITYFDQGHADVQNDGLGNANYDIHKVWACMGRVGVNGVMRAGLVDVGNPFTGSPAGWIETNAGGVFGGVNQWNALTGYDPLGGPALGDYTIYGALEPFGGVMLHLGTPLGGQPNFSLQYWSGAWNTIPFTATPDFTQASGRPNQRGQWAFIPLSPAWIAAVIGGSGTPFYFVRLLRNAVDAFGAPVANVAYKDYLYEHFKMWWSEYDLKRGDDLFGSEPTPFRDGGPFYLKFRHGFCIDGSRTNQVQNVTHGRKITTTKRVSPVYPFVIQQNRKRQMRNYQFFGGAIVGKGDVSAAAAVVSSGGSGEMVACLVSGFHRFGFGVTVSLQAGLVEDVVIVGSPDDGGPRALEGLAILSGKNISVYYNQFNSSVHFNMIRLTSVGNIQGLKFSDDALGTGDFLGQISKINVGLNYLIDHTWGGPSDKLAPTSAVSEVSALIEVRRLYIHVYENASTLIPPAGIPVRITGSNGVVQVQDVLNVNGECDFTNLLGNPTVGVESRRMIWASKWVDSVGGTETVLDEPLKIEINRSDMAGFNSDYLSMTIYMRFPRDLFFNLTTGLWEYAEWQRRDASLLLGLPRREAPTIQVESQYVRQPVPNTPFTPQVGPVTVFAPQDVPEVAFVRAVLPETGYAPCDDAGSPTDFTHQPEASTAFTHQPIPEVEYVECGTPFPGKVIILGPWMPMRLSDT